MFGVCTVFFSFIEGCVSWFVSLSFFSVFGFFCRLVVLGRGIVLWCKYCGRVFFGSGVGFGVGTVVLGEVWRVGSVEF